MQEFKTHIVCKYCDKVCFDENELRSDALLKKHMLEEHPFMILHQCGLCCFDTTNEIEFNWHLATFHLNPDSTECSLCHIKFRSKRSLVRHADVHFKPKQQQKSSRKRKSLVNGHLKCRYCPKYFILAFNRIQHEKLAHSKAHENRRYEMFKYKCSLCKLCFMTRKEKLNHELGFHCLKRIVWDNSTQKVRDQSWCQDPGLLPRRGENAEVKLFANRSKARKFYHKKIESDPNNPTQRETTIQALANQHVQRLISSSRSGKPFNKKLSMMTDCEFCPRRYASRAALRAHEKRDHMDPNEIWLCLFCPKTYICK